MRILRSELILALFLIAVSLSGCYSGGGNTNAIPSNDRSNTNRENANTAKTNAEELGLLVKILYETEDIVWKDDTTNRKLIAVLRFSTVDADKIVVDAEKFGVPVNVNIAAETWFPSELIAQSDMSGDSALKGFAYPANAFFQEPYTAGRITRIDGGDYFVLELSVK